jgi:hypothetical protein
MFDQRFLFFERAQLPGIFNDVGLLGLGVEVGTRAGVFAKVLREKWDGAVLWCVDPWSERYDTNYTQPAHDAYREAARRALDATGKPYELFSGTSLMAAEHFHRNGVAPSWVYLDGDHSREAVEADIAAWWPLLLDGGMLCGHDYVADGWHRANEPGVAFPTREEAGSGGHQVEPFGVKGAVDAFVRRRELSLYTSDPAWDGGWVSWAVAKL